MLSEYQKKRQAIMWGTVPVKEENKQAPIKKISDKRKEENKDYKKLVKEMLKESDRCEIKAQGCTGKAQGLHHRQKRGKWNLTERANLMRACNNCNLFVELHPDVAIEKGWSISKHKL